VQGPGALAGTIELQSATPAQIRGARGRFAYGSRDAFDAHAGLGVPLGSGFLAVSGAWMRGDGFIPVIREQRGPADRPSPYEQMSLAVRGVVPLGRATELQASATAFSDERERGTALSGIRTRGADASLRLVGRRWSVLGYVQSRDFYNSFASLNAGRTVATRTSEQYSVPATALGARVEARPSVGRRIELRLGGDWREAQGETRERFTFVAGQGTRGRVAGGSTQTLGGFAEAAWTGEAVTITAGGRIDRWSISNGRLHERVLATGQVLTDTGFRDRSGWQPTGRAGIAWRAGALTLRGAAYLGWRLPTLNELYRPFRVGTDATAANAELAPERLEGVEAGFDWRPAPRARIGLTLFANRLEDAIANVTLGRGPGTFPGVGFVAPGGEFRQRRNLDSIQAKGVELDTRYALGAWTLSGGWSWVDAEVSSSGPAGALDGLRPAQTPRHSVSSTLAWANEGGARASVTARYTGSQYEDDLNRQRLPGAFTLDAAGSVPLRHGIALEARAENVTNARILAGVSGDGIEERATPRTLWIGLRFGLR
jgi:vitamin B12 transporter